MYARWLAGWRAGWLSLLLDALGSWRRVEGMEVDASVYLEVFPDVEVAVSPGRGYPTQDRELQNRAETLYWW